MEIEKFGRVRVGDELYPLVYANGNTLQLLEFLMLHRDTGTRARMISTIHLCNQEYLDGLETALSGNSVRHHLECVRRPQPESLKHPEFHAFSSAMNELSTTLRRIVQSTQYDVVFQGDWQNKCFGEEASGDVSTEDLFVELRKARFPFRLFQKIAAFVAQQTDEKMRDNSDFADSVVEHWIAPAASTRLGEVLFKCGALLPWVRTFRNAIEGFRERSAVSKVLPRFAGEEVAMTWGGAHIRRMKGLLDKQGGWEAEPGSATYRTAIDMSRKKRGDSQ